MCAGVAFAANGPLCLDSHNQCFEWAWAGECDQNEAYMAQSCRLACGFCSRNASVSVDADGSVTSDSTAEGGWNDLVLSGIVPDPEGKWRGEVRNPTVAVPNTATGGVEISIVHSALGVGSVDVLWESDGRTRDSEGGTKMFSLSYGERTKVNTYEDHVFRITAVGQPQETLTSFKVMPNRPTFVLETGAIEKYASEDWCVDSHPSCPERAARGECSSSPGWMIMKCSRACESCHLRDPDARCPRNMLNVRQTPSLLPGGVHMLYETLQERFPQFNITVHSRPGGARPGEEALDIANGPWIVTFDDFVSEQEGADILGTVNSQFTRSTDQGTVNKYGEMEKIVSQSRTSENAWCMDGCVKHPSTVAVMQRIQEVTGVHVDNFESFQVLRYNVGQQYRAHHDMATGDNQGAAGPRIYTFFLYLSDVEEGGETEFPLVKRPSGATVKVTPKRGSAVLWPSVQNDNPTLQDPRTRHAALPVKKGVKFAANAWIHMFDYSVPNLWGCTGAFT
jgi:prolyl 4-hydroxylase